MANNNIPDAIRNNFQLPVGGAVMDKAIKFFDSWFSGDGSPEGVVTAAVGKFYMDLTNGAIYAKTSGSGNTGWTDLGGSGGAPSGPAGGVLGGTYPDPSFAVDMATQAELDNHLSDTTDAHDASAISFSPTGTIGATDVQTAIAEVASEAGGGTTTGFATIMLYGG